MFRPINIPKIQNFNKLVGLKVHGNLKCTKTIQFGERLLHIPLLTIVNLPLCPVSAYLRMIRLVPARRSCPIFFIVIVFILKRRIIS